MCSLPLSLWLGGWCYSQGAVWGYSGGGGVAALVLAPKAGTQTVPWLLAAQPQETGCPGAVGEGEKRKTLGVSGQGYLHCSPGGL